jgi:hypothetical protein
MGSNIVNPKLERNSGFAPKQEGKIGIEKVVGVSFDRFQYFEIKEYSIKFTT